MKFLACARCFTLVEPTRRRQQRRRPEQLQETANPPVAPQRRAAPKLPQARAADERSGASTSGKSRFPASILRALASPGRPPPPPPPRKRKSGPWQRSPVGVGRTQRLIDMYEERADSPEAERLRRRAEEHLVDPPASFGDDDDGHGPPSRPNFEKKLSSLDFRRMNTVGLGRSPSRGVAAAAAGVPGPAARSASKRARTTLLEDLLGERPKIERAMIELGGRGNGSAAREEEEKEEDGRPALGTEVRLSVVPAAGLEDVYVERTTTYLEDRTVEDRSLVLRIGGPRRVERTGGGDEDGTPGGRRRRAEVVLPRDFGRLKL